MPKLNSAILYLIVLAVAAAAVGYFAFQQVGSVPELPSPQNGGQPSQDEQPQDGEQLQDSEGDGGTAPFVITAPIPQGISADERAALQALVDATSDEEVAAVVEELHEVAQETNTLEFTNCVGDPAVLRIRDGEQMTVKNNSAEALTLEANQNEYSVPANGETQIPAGFGAGSGVYGYNCVSSSASYGGAVLVVD